MRSFASSLVDFETVLDHVYNDENGLQNVFSVQVTGGCSNLIHWLFVVPGASKAVVETVVPYSNIALNEQIGLVTQACSSETAIRLSEQAKRRAIELHLKNTFDLRSLLNVNIFGISCTAALATSRPKKGDHRCYIAASKMTENIVYNINFVKDRNTRIGEDTLCSVLALQMIANSSSSIPPLSPAENVINDLVSNGIESFHTETIPKLGLLHRLYSKTIHHALVLHKSHNSLMSPSPSLPDLSTSTDGGDFLSKYSYYEDINVPPGSLVFSGSFNPLHQGHIDLVQAAVKAVHNHQTQAQTGSLGANVNMPPIPLSSIQIPVIFELAIINADKPPLSEASVLQRLSQFSIDNPLFQSLAPPLTNFAVSLTTVPLFLHKANIFRNCYFVIGIDTYLRLIDVKYYQYDILEMISALTSIKEKGIKFVVGGRVVTDTIKKENKKFVTLQDILDQNEVGNNDENTNFVKLPPSLQNIFIGITESEFRRDISSTEIRIKQQGSS